MGLIDTCATNRCWGKKTFEKRLDNDEHNFTNEQIYCKCYFFLAITTLGRGQKYKIMALWQGHVLPIITPPRPTTFTNTFLLYSKCNYQRQKRKRCTTHNEELIFKAYLIAQTGIMHAKIRC